MSIISFHDLLRSTPLLLELQKSIMSDPSTSDSVGVTPSTDFHLIQGRTKNSVQLVHIGYIYGKDGKPNQSGGQSWRCIQRKSRCPGRLRTLNSRTLDTSSPPTTHNHPPSAGKCNAATIISEFKSASETAVSSNHQFYCRLTATADYDMLLNIYMLFNTFNLNFEVLINNLHLIFRSTVYFAQTSTSLKWTSLKRPLRSNGISLKRPLRSNGISLKWDFAQMSNHHIFVKFFVCH